MLEPSVPPNEHQKKTQHHTAVWLLLLFSHWILLRHFGMEVNRIPYSEKKYSEKNKIKYSNLQQQQHRPRSINSTECNDAHPNSALLYWLSQRERVCTVAQNNNEIFFPASNLLL